VAKVKVEIGVACNIMQSYNWWIALSQLIIHEGLLDNVEITGVRAVGSALPDHNKNNVVGNQVKRLSLTDANRTEVIKGFLESDSDYIFWMDDDTAPPRDAITRLYGSGRDFIGGVYFLPAPPYNPIAYKLSSEGMYAPVYGYSEGSIIQVDSIGMGCTLIHKSVYEKIKAGHQVFERVNGSLAAIPNDRVRKPYVNKHLRKELPTIRDGYYREQYTPVDPKEDRIFPYYLLEHGRTEDHYFCELAANVGIKPWLDTMVVCNHWKMNDTTFKTYQEHILKEEGIQ